MYSFERFIDMGIAVATVSPSFDNSGVISERDDCVRAVAWEDAIDCIDQQFEGDGFGPADVSGAVSTVLPAWYESPRSPALTDFDSNANFRASIGEGQYVGEKVGRGDGTLDVA